MISDIYLCKTKQTLKTKAGKSYYSMMLQDKTGTVDAKVWELTPGIEYFEPMDFIKVEGQVTSFQGSLQLNLRVSAVPKRRIYSGRLYAVQPL